MTTLARPRLPEYGSPFVGRGEELARLGEAVAAGRQLITLIGPGGVGKTRLAVQYARTLPHLAADPPAGPVWFCDLSAAQSAADVCGAVSRALDMPFDAGPPTADAASRIGHWLRGCGPSVLILTGFEHAARHASFTVGVWHATAPEVVFLIASREPLRLPHEVKVDVLPMPPPVVNVEASVAAGENDAARVFLAAAPAGSVEPTRPADARLVAEIVRRLQGVPLALEIAAGALRDTSLADVAAALAAPSPPFPPGPASLVRETDADRAVRRAAELACDGLPAPERELLVRSSLYAGGFTTETVRAVMPDDVTVRDGLETVAASLVARGLLHRDPAGDARYGFWPPVREVAARRITDAAERDEFSTRFAAYFLAQGEAWAEEAEGTDGGAALARLAMEHDNLRAVLKAALAAERADDASVTRALRAARSLSPLLSTRGTLASHLSGLDEVLHVAGSVDAVRETALFASVVILRGEARLHRGRADDAAVDAEHARALASSTGDAQLGARATSLLAAVARARSDLTAAEALTRTARDEYLALGDHVSAGRALGTLGSLRIDAGDVPGGEALLREALAAQRASGDRAGLGVTLTRLGEAALQRAEWSVAAGLLDEALAAHRSVGARRHEATALGMLARAQHAQGQLPNARRGYRLAVAMAREFGDRRMEGEQRAQLAALDLEEKKLDPATRGLREALGTLRTVRDVQLEAWVLGAVAATHAARGALEESEASLEQCREALERSGNDAERGGALVEAWRAACDAARAERARRAGDDASADALLAAARARSKSVHVDAADRTRFALRVFARFADAAAPPWRIDAAGQWFEPPERARVELASQPTRAGVLAALLRAREERPGEPLGADELARIACGSAHRAPRSRRNRARLAARALLRAGLAPLLRERDGGFLLDHRAGVRVVHPQG